MVDHVEKLVRHEVMKPDQELALAAQLFEHKLALWRALLSYEPLAEGVAELIESATEPESECRALLASWRARAKELRARRNRSGSDEFAAAANEMAEPLAMACPDGELLDDVFRDIEAICRGEKELRALRPRRLPPRSSQRFLDFVERVRAARTAFYTVRNDFASRNMRLVAKTAQRFRGQLPFADLMQEGNTGLIKAVNRFDHRKGFRFATYAVWWIRHAISRAIETKARTVRLPSYALRTHHQLNAARRKLEGDLGREAYRHEIAFEANVDTDKIERLELATTSPLSLDTSSAMGEEDRPLGDTLVDPASLMAFDRVVGEQVTCKLMEALESLKPIECDIVRKRYGLEGDGSVITLGELGKRYNISRERVRQLQLRALRKMRFALQRSGVQDPVLALVSDSIAAAA